MSTDATIRDSRMNYTASELDVQDVDPNPMVQACRWIDDAVAHPDIVEANAVTIASVSADGRPSARIVLLRGIDDHGFVFFTNYDSRKGRDLDATGDGAMLFFWDRLERELRIEGRAERIASDESDAYFSRRPRGHRLSAWASPQSRVVADRAVLEQAMHDAEVRFPGDDVPRPPYWGGYRIVAEQFEFWQGRKNRVHDRIVYRRNHDGWERLRLAP